MLVLYSTVMWAAGAPSVGLFRKVQNNSSFVHCIVLLCLGRYAQPPLSALNGGLSALNPPLSEEAKAEGTDMLSRTLKDGFRANEQRTILLLLLVCRGGATRQSRKARPDAQHGWLSVGSFRS